MAVIDTDGGIDKTDEPPKSGVQKVARQDKRMLTAVCMNFAERLVRLWCEKPDENMKSIRYDEEKEVFVITHRIDGEFKMSLKVLLISLKIKHLIILVESLKQELKPSG